MKTIKITTHWSAEEAESVYQLLADLQAAIWQGYGNEIDALHATRWHEQQTVNDQGEDFNDQNPF